MAVVWGLSSPADLDPRVDRSPGVLGSCGVSYLLFDILELLVLGIEGPLLLRNQPGHD